MDPETRPSPDEKRSRPRRWIAWGPVLLTSALLVGAAAETYRRSVVEGVPEYHAKIAEAAKKAFPASVGEWLGRSVESPPSAIALLRPNSIECRRYMNVRTRESATVLFVHCGDARDLLGHYPPVCYPAHGKTMDGAEDRDWTVGGNAIAGKRYRFSASELAGDRSFVVDNFMVLPTGTYGRDMQSLQVLAADRRLRQLGAAEVQVVTDASMSDERRDEVLRVLLQGAEPLFECVEGGIPRE